MQADVELTLSHDGQDWIASNGDLVARGETLSDLDADVERALRERDPSARHQRITIFMGFDFSLFPTWLRQYHAHYFNRYLTIEPTVAG